MHEVRGVAHHRKGLAAARLPVRHYSALMIGDAMREEEKKIGYK